MLRLLAASLTCLVALTLVSRFERTEPATQSEMLPDGPVARTSDDADATSGSAAAPPRTTDAALAEAVLGQWETYHKGQRTMEVRDDGTATIVAHLTDYSWAEKLAVGAERVRFEVAWTIEDGRLHFHTTGGEPEYSVGVITRVHGTEQTHEIVHCNGQEFRYRAVKPENPDYVWSRAVEAE